MRRVLLVFLLLLPLHAAHSEPLWQTLPPTPAPVPGEHAGRAKVNGISLYYATIGHGSPVVLLHGGLSNLDYWGNQIKALAPHHTVIVVDMRGNHKVAYSLNGRRNAALDVRVSGIEAQLHVCEARLLEEMFQVCRGRHLA